MPGTSCDLDLLNTGLAGCECATHFNTAHNEGKQCENHCKCNSDAYNRNRELKVRDFSVPEWHASIRPIVECSQECDCNESRCTSRNVQLGCRFELEVVKREEKGGFGVCTRSRITAGSFVIEYVGEWIGLEESKRLLSERTVKSEQNYVMFLREYASSGELVATTVIDAKNYANTARFINHSCEPNLFVLPVRIGCVLPRAALFALRDIEIGEELSYDYSGGSTIEVLSGESQKEDKYRTKCRCGSGKCRGFLPDNNV